MIIAAYVDDMNIMETPNELNKACAESTSSKRKIWGRQHYVLA